MDKTTDSASALPQNQKMPSDSLSAASQATQFAALENQRRYSFSYMGQLRAHGDSPGGSGEEPGQDSSDCMQAHSTFQQAHAGGSGMFSKRDEAHTLSEDGASQHTASFQNRLAQGPEPNPEDTASHGSEAERRAPSGGGGHAEDTAPPSGGKGGGIFDEQNIKCSVELKSGLPRRRLSSRKNSNALSLHHYGGIVGCLVFLHDLLVQFDHGIIALHWLVMYQSGAHQAGAYDYIVAVTAVSLLVRGAMLLSHDRNLRDAADAVNAKPVEKFVFLKRRKCFQVLDWASIQTGDIIKVRQNQEIPCDALILDIVGSRAGSQTCYMRGGLWDDPRDPVPKASYQGTMNKTGNRISDARFVEQISGLLKWEYNHFGYLSGSFKQIDSPAAFDITGANVFQRGCYFTDARACVCLALNVGALAMGNQNRLEDTKEGRVKHWFRQKRGAKGFESAYIGALKAVQSVSLLVCFLPVILLVLDEMVLQNLPAARFAAAWRLRAGESTGLSGARYARYWSALAGFMMNLPYLAKLTIDGVVFFHAYYAMWDVNLVPAAINFTDLRAMKSLGQVDSLVCSKAALAGSQLARMVSFKVSDKLFRNQKGLRAATNAPKDQGNRWPPAYNEGTSQHSSSDSSEEQAWEQIDYLPNHTFCDPYFDCPEAQELISCEQRTPKRRLLQHQFEEFLTALALCHHSWSNSRPFSGGCKSLYKDEEPQIKFAEYFGYRFMSRRHKLLTIVKRSEHARYDEIVLRRVPRGGDSLTMQAIKDFSYDAGVTIYYRARLSILKDFLPRAVAKRCQADIDKAVQEGVHMYGIGKYEMSAEASSDFVSEGQSAYKGAKHDKSDQLLLRYAHRMRLIGVWGAQKAVNARDGLVVEEMRRNGVKLFVLSRDDPAVDLADCNALGLLEDYSPPLTVEGRTDRLVEESLKSILKQVVERRMTKVRRTSPNPGTQSKKMKRQQESGGAKRDRRADTTPDASQTEQARKPSGQDRAASKAGGEANAGGGKADQDFGHFAERNAVIFDGHVLAFILKDETLLKLFLTLCSLSGLCIGSSIGPQQKAMLVRAIRAYAIAGRQGTVISVIADQTDKFTVDEADVSIGLITPYKQSDILAQTDIQMKNMYGLTYLLSKHGTLAHRRSKVVLDNFIYRTILTMLVQSFFFVTNGFSFLLPYGRFFFTFFMALLTPIQFWLEGISHTDYCYGVFHRVFGEYRHNQTLRLQYWSYAGVVVTAVVDAGISCLVYVIASFHASDLQVTQASARVLSRQSFVLLNSIVLAMMHIARVSAIRSSTSLFNVSRFLFFLCSLAFVLEDEHLAGFQMLLSSVNAMAYLAFAALVLGVRVWLRLVYQVVLPQNLKSIDSCLQEVQGCGGGLLRLTKRLCGRAAPRRSSPSATAGHRTKRKPGQSPSAPGSQAGGPPGAKNGQAANKRGAGALQTYTAIEDRLFMEEYEDPEQQFCIRNLPNYKALIATLETDAMSSVNQNLLKVHRTDSVDEIIDRLNAASGQVTGGSGHISKFTLKLNDVNKELEYSESKSSNRQVQHCVPLVWTSVAMYVALCVFKITNSVIESQAAEARRAAEAAAGGAGTDASAAGGAEGASKGSTLSTSYFEIAGMVLCLASIYLIRRVKNAKSHLVILGLVLYMNVVVVIQFVIDQDSALTRIQFVYTLAFSFGCRLSSFFGVSAVCICSSLALLNISMSGVQASDQARGVMLHQVWQAVAIVVYLFQWVYYTYWDELKRKIQFVAQYRKVKEFQKLRGIINLLIPSLVRSRIQEGKKNFSEAQGEVTIIFIDIEGFDQIVQTYAGRDLIELLDKAYNAFDQLCEQFGVTKIETVGKTYMACGGLKVSESAIDSRLLGSHHSVRVVDFACLAQRYAETVAMKNGEKLQVKIGVHTGEVISGVVGETKPQFSLIGDTVNKSSRVCAKCPTGKILISKETHQALEGNSNNFQFQGLAVEMKGIGREAVYTVRKRNAVRKRTSPRRAGRGQPGGRTDDAGGPGLAFRRGSAAPGGRPPGSEKEHPKDGEDACNLGEQSSRSLRSSDGDHPGAGQTAVVAAASDGSEAPAGSVDGSYSAEGGGDLQPGDFLEDRQIVQSAAQNERYQLVERPHFLLQLELKEQEQTFFATQWNRNLAQELTCFFLKCMLDIVVVQCAVLIAYEGAPSAQVSIAVGCLHFVFVLICTAAFYRAQGKDSPLVTALQVLGYVASVGLLVAAAPFYMSRLTSRIEDEHERNRENDALMKSQQLTVALYVMTFYMSKGFPFRLFVAAMLVMVLGLVVQNYAYVAARTINLQTFIIDALLNILLAAFFVIASYSREMKSRKIYNQERIMEVEVEKTEDLLSKLVPSHVLQGIKNDQKVVDVLDNVTLLYTDMVGFTEFSKNVSKPQEVVQLLSRLFSKFDELCAQHKVYKVHTIGDCYVTMGYTGKIAKERRTTAVQIEEALKVVKVGLEMIEIVNEERERTKNPALKNLDMRIGVHTGRIVGGIIGTKVVRYDIFGPDVLIANKMESHGQAGAVVISEATHALLKQSRWIFDTFDMQPHAAVAIGAVGKTIKSYKVEQIFAAGYSSSEDADGIARGEGSSGEDGGSGDSGEESGSAAAARGRNATEHSSPPGSQDDDKSKESNH